MKVEPPNQTKKPPEDQFKALGRKVMGVPKAEVDARDKAWRDEKLRTGKTPKSHRE